MKRCKITILQRTLNEELAREYAAPGFTRCPMMREGQVFYADYAKPEGFCDEAWKAVYQYVFALSHGAGKFYFGDWITKEGVAICSCNDGLRPVIMKSNVRTRTPRSITNRWSNFRSSGGTGTNISKRRCGLNTRSAVSHPVSGSAYSSSVFSSIRLSAASNISSRPSRIPSRVGRISWSIFTPCRFTTHPSG